MTEVDATVPMVLCCYRVVVVVVFCLSMEIGLELKVTTWFFFCVDESLQLVMPLCSGSLGAWLWRCLLLLLGTVGNDVAKRFVVEVT